MAECVYVGSWQPASVNADGLYKYLMRGLARVNVEDWESKLVGFGCDGASVNFEGSFGGGLSLGCVCLVYGS